MFTLKFYNAEECRYYEAEHLEIITKNHQPAFKEIVNSYQQGELAENCYAFINFTDLQGGEDGQKTVPLFKGSALYVVDKFGNTVEAITESKIFVACIGKK